MGDGESRSESVCAGRRQQRQRGVSQKRDRQLRGKKRPLKLCVGEVGLTVEWVVEKSVGDRGCMGVLPWVVMGEID